MTGITVGNVPVIYTYPTPPPNNISDVTMNPGQIIYDLSDTDNSSIGLYMMKGGAPGSQVWVRFASLAEVTAMMPARSQSAATRSLNTIFQVSATRWTTVRYSVDISTTVSLTGSQVGTVVLEMATNSAFTTGVQTLQQFSNGNSGTLVVGLVLTQLNTACLSGDIPPGNYVRLRTVNTTGTPTFTYQAGQEVLL
jgi:hypothetical protein